MAIISGFSPTSSPSASPSVRHEPFVRIKHQIIGKIGRTGSEKRNFQNILKMWEIRRKLFAGKRETV